MIHRIGPDISVKAGCNTRRLTVRHSEIAGDIIDPVYTNAKLAEDAYFIISTNCNKLSVPRYFRRDLATGDQSAVIRGNLIDAEWDRLINSGLDVVENLVQKRRIVFRLHLITEIGLHERKRIELGHQRVHHSTDKTPP